VILETHALPDAPGVNAALRILETAIRATDLERLGPDRLGPERLELEKLGHEFAVSVGRVCGGRVSGVYLGASLEVVSFTLEPHELEDEAVGRARALEFLAELESLARD
jgi:hypothetical protein